MVMDTLFVWVARSLLLAIIVVFILGSGPVQQRMRGYPGKSVTRLLWLAAVSPWRVQEVETDFLRQGFPSIIWVFIVTLLGIGTATFFMSPLLLLSVFQFLLFVVVMLLVFFVSTRINENGSYIVAALAPLTVLIGLLMAMGSVQGFTFIFHLFWVNPIFHTAVITIALFLIAWQFFTIVVISHKAIAISLISSIGRLFIVVGFVLMMIGVTIGTIGLEETINVLNYELAVLPIEFSESLGIMMHTNIVFSNPWNIVIVGGILIVVGVLLWAVDYLRRRRQTELTDAHEPAD